MMPPRRLRIATRPKKPAKVSRNYPTYVIWEYGLAGGQVVALAYTLYDAKVIKHKHWPWCDIYPVSAVQLLGQ